MFHFNNDYNQGAHPAVLQALTDTNQFEYNGYGLDPWCEKAAGAIQMILAREDTDIHFLIGGTQTNFTAIAACLKSYQSVISPDSGHIQAHETGAVEHGGHKILTLPATEGKITADQIASVAEEYRVSPIQEHITQPKLVYLSFPTEYGTIYKLRELEDIHFICRKYGLYLYLDGARMGYGLAASQGDVTLKDIGRLADIFSIGGTKCGALFGEALVITNPELKPDFRSYIKQNGAMLAKGWLLGVQFDTLFQDGLYFRITRKAVELAMELKAAFKARGIPFFLDSPTNQQFVILSSRQIQALEKKYVFEIDHVVDSDHFCVRFCTSWSTTEEEVRALSADISLLPD